MEFKVEHINWMFLAGVFLGFIFFIYGFEFFIKDTQYIGIITATGMLTFVSVFFTFVYSPIISPWRAYFQEFIEHQIIPIREKAKKKASELNFKALREIADEIEEIKDLQRKINPELWLYLSVFLYLFSIGAGMLPDEELNLLNISFTNKHVQATFFYLGFISTFFLMFSIFFLAWLVRQRKKET